MGKRNEKLNQLARLLPEGLVADTAWLDRHGFRRQWREGYLKRGWLKHVARSVYQRPSASETSEIAWQRVVISLQTLMDYKVHVGGRTALKLHGLDHYLQLSGPADIHLHAHGDLPGWLKKMPADGNFITHNAETLFASDAPGLTETPWGHWDWTIRISAPERALCEVLDELPGRESFDHADKLMQSAATLSPRRVQAALEACRSIKVKRLFLWLAERHSHSWLKKLDLDRINLGRGKRQLVPEGRLDPKYMITVPDLGSANA